MNKLNSIQNGNSSLKACPFCGGEAKLSAPNMHGISNVICPKCGMTGSYGNEETITAAWNRRTQPENKPMTNFDRITESSEALAGEINLMHHCDPKWQKDFLDWLNEPEEENDDTSS